MGGGGGGDTVNPEENLHYLGLIIEEELISKKEKCGRKRKKCARKVGRKSTKGEFS
jgi:hypothetical protein